MYSVARKHSIPVLGNPFHLPTHPSPTLPYLPGPARAHHALASLHPAIGVSATNGPVRRQGCKGAAHGMLVRTFSRAPLSPVGSRDRHAPGGMFSKDVLRCLQIAFHVRFESNPEYGGRIGVCAGPALATNRACAYVGSIPNSCEGIHTRTPVQSR